MLFDTNIDSIEEVLAIRTKAKQMLLEGATTVSWNSEGTGVTKQITMPIKQVLDESAAFLKAIAPDVYGRPIKRISPTYTNF